MLVRNLNTSQGLCNRTRLICISFRRNVIEAQIATGTHIGEIVLLPRITITSKKSECPIEFQCTQFPIRLAFSMTINKAQGQTFDTIGLYLRNPVFTHGLLYVAFLRVKTPNSIFITLGRNESTINGQEERQKAASKASLKSANTERTTESVRRTIKRVREENAALKKKCYIYDTYYEKVDEEALKNKFSQENLNSEDKSMKNQYSQESSDPHISNAMLEINTFSAATSQGDSDMGVCESEQGEFICMIACANCMDTLYNNYGCHFVDELINKLEKEKIKYKRFFKNFFEYHINNSIASERDDTQIIEYCSNKLDKLIETYQELYIKEQQNDEYTDEE
ncbi:hypothetical protein INT45_004468 [Circinella minor]|uniref:DNA helicase Pif1-like 2B domain-containing protein n=1 Tax=Circinella minor TaxID=1195481 RepID=A0A8H7RSH6_9FUNG|nr:hypothetical protein INT45_004468 [Circinella minor]